MRRISNKIILIQIILICNQFFILAQPAARVGDMHICPLVTPGLPPIPHVGGSILPPGCPTVLICGMPAARVGDFAHCVGAVDAIALGCTTVLIGGKPAARMGDPTVHGGIITQGCNTVLIGSSGGASSISAVKPALSTGTPALHLPDKQ